MELDKNKTYLDKSVKPAQTLKFIRKVVGIYRFARVSDHPAVSGNIVDYNKSDLIFLKEI